MSTIVLFDSRFATSIASAAIVKSKIASEAIDTAVSLSKKKTDALKAKVKKADVVYVMVDDNPYDPKKKAEVHYIKPGKEDEARRVLEVWNKVTGNLKVPLIIHYLSNIRLSDSQKECRAHVKNAIPTYLSDLEGASMAQWIRLLREPQDVAFLNQLVANGQIIEDYKKIFGTSDTDKVSAQDLKASVARVAKLEDQEEKIEELESDLEKATGEMELRGKSIENYSKDKEELLASIEKLETKLEEVREAHSKTELNLENSLKDGAEAKKAVASKTKEIALVRQDLEKSEPILQKEKDAHKKTQEALTKVREDLAVSKKKSKESRSDYEKEVKAVVKLETKVTEIIAKVESVKIATQTKADKDAKKISDLEAEVVKLKKPKK